jgi:hypothetical protein
LAAFDLLEAVAHGNSTAKDCKSLVYRRCGGPDARGASGPTWLRVASRSPDAGLAGHRTALGQWAPLCGHTSAREPEGPAAGGAASGLSCLPEAIHRALRKEAGGGQL